MKKSLILFDVPSRFPVLETFSMHFRHCELRSTMTPDGMAGMHLRFHASMIPGSGETGSAMRAPSPNGDIVPSGTTEVDAEFGSNEPESARLVLGLPRLAIDGEYHDIIVRAVGMVGQANVFVEAADVAGCGLHYALGLIEPAGTQALSAMMKHPKDRWSALGVGEKRPFSGPLHFLRIGFTLQRPTVCFEVVLLSLDVTGDIRFSAPGIT